MTNSTNPPSKIPAKDQEPHKPTVQAATIEALDASQIKYHRQICAEVRAIQTVQNHWFDYLKSIHNLQARDFIDEHGVIHRNGLPAAGQ